MSSYEVRASHIAYDGRLSRVRVDAVLMPDGDVAEREVVEHPDAVAVVPLTPDGEVVLLHQYRHPIGGFELEIPAGKLDVEHETPEAAARRELREEAGLEADELEWLVAYHNSSGWTDESTTVYLARGVRDVGFPDGFTARHEEADMRIVRLPLDEVAGRAARGELTDAKTLIGVLVAQERLRATPGRKPGQTPGQREGSA